ncbi:MAG: CYTH domain-containing protein [Gammaproteobacteria bacterium]
MPLEIERKFLVNGDAWRRQAGRKAHFRQGYLAGGAGGSVRVRVVADKATLNIKSATVGVERLEFEYPIPIAEGRQILDSLCMRPLIEKTRYFVDYAGKTWEVDEFEGDNAGLIVAEIELTQAHEAFELPAWAGEEVSYDARYYNSSLVKNPYGSW